MKILIAGITGYLGSHTAEQMIKEGHSVYGLYRENSKFDLISDLCKNIELYNYNDYLKNIDFDILIYSTWSGVESKDRNNPEIQLKNISLLINTLNKLNLNSLKKIIFYGSQSEYGEIHEKIDENFSITPNTSYGYSKLSCLEIIKSYSKIYNFQYVWARIFSIYGGSQSKSWLVPSLIEKLMKNEKMQLTLCEQKVAYLYIKDFTEIIGLLCENHVTSGVYNVCSDHSMKLKDFITKIKDIINPSYELSFGELDYPENYSTCIVGKTKKIKKELGVYIDETDFHTIIKKIYHENKNL